MYSDMINKILVYILYRLAPILTEVIIIALAIFCFLFIFIFIFLLNRSRTTPTYLGSIITFSTYCSSPSQMVGMDMTQKYKQVSLDLSYEDYFNMTSRTGTQNTWNFNPLSQNTWNFNPLSQNTLNFNPLSQNKFHKLHTPARLHYKYPKKILELPHESYKFWCPNFKVP